MSNSKALIFSFFSGAGFLDLGFEHEDFEVAFVNEFHKPFLAAYKYSRRKMDIEEPRFGYYLGSITDLHSGGPNQQLSTHVAAAKQTGLPVGFIGGPPCPDFSVGGKNRGRDGENGKLTLEYAHLITTQKPDFFVFENVKGLWRTKRHREFFNEVKVKLEAAGYILTERLTNSIEFGAPQDRDRILLIGFQLSFLKELRGQELSQFEAEMLLQQEFPWETAIKFPDRQAFNYAWPITSRFEENSVIPAPNGIPKELTVESWFMRNQVDQHPNAKHVFQPRAGLVRFQSVLEGDDSKKSFKRLHRWRYSPTAAYGNNEVHLHPYKARRLTVAEALAIQSLPSSYELPDSMTLSDMFKTVGNGVPFLMARGIAATIAAYIEVNHETYSFGISQGHRPATKAGALPLH